MPIARRLAPALFALLVASALPAAAQPFQIEPVFLPETPLPLPDAGAGWDTYSFHENADRQLALSVMKGPAPYQTAALRRTGDTIELIARNGDAAPGLIGGVFDEVYPVGIASSGDVILYGVGCEPAEDPVYSDCAYGLYRATPSGLVTLALSGQGVPGTGGRTLFPTSPYNFAVGADGRVVVHWPLAPDQLRAFLVAHAGSITPFALEGDPAPGTSQSFASFSGQEPEVNSAGAIAFEATFQFSPIQSGLFLWSGGATRPVVLPGMAAPGGGTFLGVGQNWGLDELGNVAFDSGTLSGGDYGIFVDSGGSLRAVVRSGEPVPGSSAAFEQLHSPDLHAGVVAFSAFGQGSDYPVGIYAEVNGEIVTVARQGDPAPDGIAGHLSEISSPRFGGAGDILFSVNLAEMHQPTRYAFFRARLAPQVPALGAPAAVLLAATLLASARLRFRRDAQRPAGR